MPIADGQMMDISTSVPRGIRDSDADGLSGRRCSRDSRVRPSGASRRLACILPAVRDDPLDSLMTFDGVAREFAGCRVHDPKQLERDLVAGSGRAFTNSG